MRRFYLCTLLFLFPAFSSAGVNVKNGNFYITYGTILECDMLTRTYNSKSVARGWFGFGWGSAFEARLLVMGDGSAVVLENGSGATRFYGRQQGDAVTQGIEKIIADIRADKKLDAYEVKELRDKLLDADARIEKVKGYGISGQMAEGTILVSDQCSEGRLQKRGDGYVRTSCNGDLDYLNTQGWFVKHEEKNGRTLSATYGSTMYPQEIRDSTGCVARLEWKNEGMISNMVASLGDKSETHTFTYDASGNLILENIMGGNYYKYSYDSNHNMTEIGYIDQTRLIVSYDKNSLATSVTETDGSKKIYEYQTYPSGDYSTKVTQVDERGENKASWDYRYDKDGNILRSSDKHGRWVEYEYHPVFKKITRIRNAQSEKKFEYDAKGQVIQAVDLVSGKQVWLTYDDKGQIVTLTGQEGAKAARRVVQFKYNVLGKPTEISIAGEGSITVTYDDAGEIKSVDSAKGIKMALFVNQTFQSLLSLVKISGADFSF